MWFTLGVGSLESSHTKLWGSVTVCAILQQQRRRSIPPHVTDILGYLQGAEATYRCNRHLLLEASFSVRAASIVLGSQLLMIIIGGFFLQSGCQILACLGVTW